jgi:serine/threonine-protein kinase RsbW
MSDAASGVEEFVLPSELDVLERIDSLTGKYGKLAGFNDSSLMEIAIAVVEAVTNAVVHGNDMSEDKKVTVRFEWSPGVFEVAVHDEGGGFDIDRVCDPTDPERRMGTSGRGIYIMREVMDSVVFEMGKGEGTTVTLKKAI